MKTVSILLLLFSVAIFMNCTSKPRRIISGSTSPDSSGTILINQVGFLPNTVKIALLKIKADRFDIIDAATKEIVFSGKPGQLRYWDFSGDSVCTADFTKLNTPGRYQICINDSVCSHIFEIGTQVYSSIAKAALKAFYLNRSGIEISTEFGDKWARPAGHPDTIVFVHSSAATTSRPEGYKISSPGGWYDAGDYNKYIVNSAISTYTLLLFCQMYPDYCLNFKSNIPESTNNIPDVVDELLFNLRWMLTMQDPIDGGVYHKLTNKSFCNFLMPEKANDPRFVVSKSTAASLDFAATMAMASRVFAKSESSVLKNLGTTCLEAAKRAYTWAKVNPAVYFKNPSDISTGEYGDAKVSDEFFWAESELALAENNIALISKNAMPEQEINVPSWSSSGMLGIISLSLNDNPNATEFKADAKKILLDYANILVEKSENSPYKISLDFFNWGSNSDLANMAIIKFVAFSINHDKKYLASIQSDIDYLLGRNATGYCFVTGYGGKQVMNIHHRPSGSDGISDPYPGFLVGGPNTVVPDDCQGVKRSLYPAKSYSDSQCSYSTNEVAINWNAPLFFVMAAMDALDK